MPKSSLSLEARIAKLEQEKELLIQKRKNEIAEMFAKNKAVTIDNKIIIGLIKHYQTTVKNGTDKNDELIMRLRALSGKPSPSQRSKRTQQPA